MLRVSVILCLVALCASMANKDYKMKQYAHMKIMEACMTEEYIYPFFTQMKESSKKCSTQPRLLATDDIDFQDIIDEVRSMALPWGSRRESSSQYFQLVPAQGSRSKRHASSEKHTHTTAEKLYHMREKMACMIGNMTCMLRDLDWMSEDKTPNISQYEKAINDMPGSQDLKDEMLWGLDVCKDFSTCISPQRAKSPFMKELGTFITFSKCFEMKKLMACMKVDFKEYAAKEGYANIDEIIDLGVGLGDFGLSQNKEKMGINAFEASLSGDFTF